LKKNRPFKKNVGPPRHYFVRPQGWGVFPKRANPYSWGGKKTQIEKGIQTQLGGGGRIFPTPGFVFCCVFCRSNRPPKHRRGGGRAPKAGTVPTETGQAAVSVEKGGRGPGTRGGGGGGAGFRPIHPEKPAGGRGGVGGGGGGGGGGARDETPQKKNFLGFQKKPGREVGDGSFRPHVGFGFPNMGVWSPTGRGAFDGGTPKAPTLSWKPGFSNIGAAPQRRKGSVQIKLTLPGQFGGQRAGFRPALGAGQPDPILKTKDWVQICPRKGVDEGTGRFPATGFKKTVSVFP